MTKQHFIALAQSISRIENMEARREAAYAVIRVAEQFNNRFKRYTFLEACGIFEY